MENTAVILNRVSTADQEKGYSLDAQDENNLAYAKRLKLDVVRTFTFSETGSKSSQRKEYKALMAFVKENEIRHLIVEKTDRLTRNFQDAVELEDYLRKFPLTVHFAKENAQITGKASVSDRRRWLFNVFLADDFAHNLAEETKKGMRKKVESGGYPIRAPYGYWNDKNTRELKIDEEKAPIIKKIFDRYASGQSSLMNLAAWLNDEGYPAPRGIIWHNSTVHKVLTNPAYISQVRWSGNLYPGNHASIVPLEVYEQVQKLLKESGAHKTKQSFTLSGMMKMDNGRFMTGEKAKQYVYYGGRRASTGRGPRFYLREDKVFSVLDAAMENFRWGEAFAQVVVDIAKEIIAAEHSLSSDESASLFHKLTILKEKQKKLVGLHIDGVIDREIYERQYFELQRESERITAKLDQVNKGEDAKIQKILKVVDTFKALPATYQTTDRDGKGKIIRQFLDAITVSPSTGEIQLHVKYPYSIFADSLFFEVSKIENYESVRTHPVLRPLKDLVRTFLAAA